MDITSEDIVVDGRTLRALKIHICHPKEEHLSAWVMIDVFESGDFMCPMEAFNAWPKDKVVRLTATKPMFWLEMGENLRVASFNKELRKLLKSEVDYNKSLITVHSF